MPALSMIAHSLTRGATILLVFFVIMLLPIGAEYHVSFFTKFTLLAYADIRVAA
jgi:hypothetical protein